MKYAGIARVLVLAALGLTLAASSAGAATTVTPLGFVLPDNFYVAVDGTDVYWLEQHTETKGPMKNWFFGSRLMRGSLIDKSVVELGSYDDIGNTHPESLVAGGGAAYVSFSDQYSVADASLDIAVKVVRIARDGSSRRTIAKVGSTARSDWVKEHGVRRLDDCTKSVEATSVTPTGDVVISERTSERESKGCGRKKNVDHWRYYEVTTSGATHEIATESSRVTASYKVRRGKLLGAEWGPVKLPVADPWVYYGKAVFQRHRDGEFWVKDLATGVESGPYRAKVTGHDAFAWAQINSLGQLALSVTSTTGSPKHEKYHTVSGVFRTPGDPASFARMKGDSGIQFCGDHLMAANNRGARELDPANFWLQRIVAPARDIEGDSTLIDPGCTGKYMYFTRYGPSKTVLLAYPLG